MRQLVLVEPGRLEWRDAPEPILEGPIEALVRPLAVAACDLDIAAISGRAPIGNNYPLGHEFVAEVVEVGESVTNYHAGDRVLVPFQISCGTCIKCGRGQTANCETVRGGSMYGIGDLGGPWGGAWSDLVRVPFADHMLVRVPKGVSLPAAANVSDNLTDAWRTVGPYLAATPGLDVLVLGGGGPSIGVWAAELAVALGASVVDYVDDDPTRLKYAEDAGANSVEAQTGQRLPRRGLVVDVSGNSDVLAAALRATAPDGTCVSAAIYWDNPPLPLLQMYSRNVTFVTGRPHSRAQLPGVLALIESGIIDPLRIATVVPWEETVDGLRAPPVKLVASRS